MRVIVIVVDNTILNVALPSIERTLVGAAVVACAVLVVILFLPNRPPAQEPGTGGGDPSTSRDGAHREEYEPVSRH